MSEKFLLRPTQDKVKTHYDFIIIGGGPAGASTAWALNRYAPEASVLLVEKTDKLGAGSSTASLENYRSCWPTECIAKQMERSIHIFHNADEFLGEDAAQAIHLKENGYLWCAQNEDAAEGFQKDVQRIRDIGIQHIEYLNADDVRRRFPWVGENVIAAKYDPHAGWLDSNALIHAFIRASTHTQVFLGADHIQLLREHDEIRGVNINGMTFSAGAVILATGAWSNMIAETANINLPIVLRPRQSFTTGWRHEQFPEDAPMIIGAHPFPHVRPEARTGAIFGWEYAWKSKHLASNYGSNPAQDAILKPVESVNSLKDPRFPSVALMLLARQFQHTRDGFADGRYLRNISHNIGYYVSRNEMTAYMLVDDGSHIPYESERAIIDAHPEIGRLFVSIAHVGHGVMTSPAAGEIMAQRCLNLPLSHPRFADFGWNVHWVEYDEPVL